MSAGLLPRCKQKIKVNKNMEWRSVFIWIAIIGCLFIGIPIKIPKQHQEGLKTQEVFASFVSKYNKSYKYNVTEYWKRYSHFQASLKLIEELNANRTEGGAYYGITPFCDLSKDEFSKKHLRRMRRGRIDGGSDSKEHVRNRSRRAAAAVPSLPEKIDWRSRGVVSSVKNQKLCGACWAFSTVETMETMFALKNGSLPNLSVQQVINCATNGNHGCAGGDSKLLLEWLLATKTAIKTEKEYPYTQQTESCDYKPSKDGVTVKSFSCKNYVGGEDAILDLLATHGPVAVAVNAVNWQFYLGGVIQRHCSGAVTDLNHAVQLVGYVNSDVPHYIARNSWGVEFGDKGYLYLGIGNNNCGVADEVCSIDV